MSMEMVLTLIQFLFTIFEKENYIRAFTQIDEL